MGFNLFKAIGGAVGGLVRGGPVGALTGAVSGGFGGRPDSIVTRQSGIFAGGLGFGTKSTTVYGGPGQAISSYPVNGGGGGGGDTYTPYAGAPGACPTGFRLNKSTYVTRGGGTSKWPQSLVVHAKGSTCVKRRRLNAGNGRAATHAVRRLVAFYRLSNRVAKQLRKAASRAHIRGARRGQRALPRGGGVEVVNVD